MPASTNNKSIMPTVWALVLLLAAITAIAAFAYFVGPGESLLGTALIAAIGWLIRTNNERKREFEKLLNERKSEQYYKFLELLQGFFNLTDEDELADSATKEVPKETIAELKKWGFRLLMTGSDEVLRAWNEARAEAEPQEGDLASHRRILVRWARVLLAMRRDCGHFDTKLNEGDLLRVILKDSEEARRIGETADN